MNIAGAVFRQKRATAAQRFAFSAGFHFVASVCFWATLLSSFFSSVSAHEVRPAYLELRQTGPETFNVFWKVPGQGENLRLGLYVEFPAGTTNLSSPTGFPREQCLQRTLEREMSDGLATAPFVSPAIRNAD